MHWSSLLIFLPLVECVTEERNNNGIEYHGISNVRYEKSYQPTPSTTTTSRTSAVPTLPLFTSGQEATEMPVAADAAVVFSQLNIPTSPAPSYIGLKSSFYIPRKLRPKPSVDIPQKPIIHIFNPSLLTDTQLSVKSQVSNVSDSQSSIISRPNVNSGFRVPVNTTHQASSIQIENLQSLNLLETKSKFILNKQPTPKIQAETTSQVQIDSTLHEELNLNALLQQEQIHSAEDRSAIQSKLLLSTTGSPISVIGSVIIGEANTIVPELLVKSKTNKEPAIESLPVATLPLSTTNTHYHTITDVTRSPVTTTTQIPKAETLLTAEDTLSLSTSAVETRLLSKPILQLLTNSQLPLHTESSSSIVDTHSTPVAAIGQFTLPFNFQTPITSDQISKISNVPLQSVKSILYGQESEIKIIPEFGSLPAEQISQPKPRQTHQQEPEHISQQETMQPELELIFQHELDLKSKPNLKLTSQPNLNQMLKRKPEQTFHSKQETFQLEQQLTSQQRTDLKSQTEAAPTLGSTSEQLFTVFAIPEMTLKPTSIYQVTEKRDNDGIGYYGTSNVRYQKVYPRPVQHLIPTSLTTIDTAVSVSGVLKNLSATPNHENYEFPDGINISVVSANQNDPILSELSNIDQQEPLSLQHHFKPESKPIPDTLKQQFRYSLHSTLSDGNQSSVIPKPQPTTFLATRVSTLLNAEMTAILKTNSQINTTLQAPTSEKPKKTAINPPTVVVENPLLQLPVIAVSQPQMFLVPIQSENVYDSLGANHRILSNSEPTSKLQTQQISQSRTEPTLKHEITQKPLNQVSQTRSIETEPGVQSKTVFSTLVPVFEPVSVKEADTTAVSLSVEPNTNKEPAIESAAAVAFQAPITGEYFSKYSVTQQSIITTPKPPHVATFQPLLDTARSPLSPSTAGTQVDTEPRVVVQLITSPSLSSFGNSKSSVTESRSKSMATIDSTTIVSDVQTPVGHGSQSLEVYLAKPEGLETFKDPVQSTTKRTLYELKSEMRTNFKHESEAESKLTSHLKSELTPELQLELSSQPESEQTPRQETEGNFHPEVETALNLTSAQLTYPLLPKHSQMLVATSEINIKPISIYEYQVTEAQDNNVNAYYRLSHGYYGKTQPLPNISPTSNSFNIKPELIPDKDLSLKVQSEPTSQPRVQPKLRQEIAQNLLSRQEDIRTAKMELAPQSKFHFSNNGYSLKPRPQTNEVEKNVPLLLENSEINENLLFDSVVAVSPQRRDGADANLSVDTDIKRPITSTPQTSVTAVFQPAGVTAAPNPVFVTPVETRAVSTPLVVTQVTTRSQLLSTGFMRETAIQQPTVISSVQLPITSDPQFIGTLVSVSEESILSKTPVQPTIESILLKPEQNGTEIRTILEFVSPNMSEQISLQGSELTLQQKLGLHSQPGPELTHSGGPELISQPEQELVSERELEVLPQIKLNLMNERDQEQVFHPASMLIYSQEPAVVSLLKPKLLSQQDKKLSSQIKTKRISIQELEWTSERQPKLSSEQEAGLSTVPQTAPVLSKISNLSSLEELKLKQNNAQKLTPQLSFNAVPEIEAETSLYEVKEDQDYNETENYGKQRTSVLLIASPVTSNHEVSDILTADKVSVVSSQLNTPTSPGISYIGRRKPLVLPRRFRTEHHSTQQPLLLAFHRASISETQSPITPETQVSSATQVIEQISDPQIHNLNVNTTLQASNPQSAAFVMNQTQTVSHNLLIQPRTTSLQYTNLFSQQTFSPVLQSVITRSLSHLSETTQSRSQSSINDTYFSVYPSLDHVTQNQSDHALKVEISPETNSIKTAGVTAGPNPVFVAAAETEAVTTPQFGTRVTMGPQLLSTAETGIMRATGILQPTVISSVHTPITSNPQFVSNLLSVTEESVISKAPVQPTTESILHEPEQNGTEIRSKLESIRPRMSEQISNAQFKGTLLPVSEEFIISKTPIQPMIESILHKQEQNGTEIRTKLESVSTHMSEQISLQGPELTLQQKSGLHSQPGLELTHSQGLELISQPEQELTLEREPKVVSQIKLNLLNEQDQEQVFHPARNLMNPQGSVVVSLLKPELISQQVKKFNAQIKTEGTSIRELEWTSQRQPELTSEQETGLYTVPQTAPGHSKISNLSSLEELKLNNLQKLTPQPSFSAVPEEDLETSPNQAKADQDHNKLEHYGKSKIGYLNTHPPPLKQPITYPVTDMISPASKTSVLLTTSPATSDQEVSDILTADKVSPDISHISRRKPLVLPRRFRTELQSTHQPLLLAFHRASLSETQTPIIPETQVSSATQVIEQISYPQIHNLNVNTTLQASNLINNSLAPAAITPPLSSLPTINVSQMNESQISLQSTKELYVTGSKHELKLEPQAKFQIKINSSSQSITKEILKQGLNMNLAPQSEQTLQLVTQAKTGSKTSASTTSTCLPKTFQTQLQYEKELGSLEQNPEFKFRSFEQLVEKPLQQKLELQQQREQTSLKEAELNFLSKPLFGTSPQPYPLKLEKQQAFEALESLAVKETYTTVLPLLNNLIKATILTPTGADNFSSIYNVEQLSITTTPQTPVFALSPSGVVTASNPPLVGGAETQVVSMPEVIIQLTTSSAQLLLNTSSPSSVSETSIVPVAVAIDQFDTSYAVQLPVAADQKSREIPMSVLESKNITEASVQSIKTPILNETVSEITETSNPVRPPKPEGIFQSNIELTEYQGLSLEKTSPLKQLMSQQGSTLKLQVKADMASQNKPELISEPEEDLGNKTVPNLPAVLQTSDSLNLRKQVTIEANSKNNIVVTDVDIIVPSSANQNKLQLNTEPVHNSPVLNLFQLSAFNTPQAPEILISQEAALIQTPKTLSNQPLPMVATHSSVATGSQSTAFVTNQSQIVSAPHLLTHSRTTSLQYTNLSSQQTGSPAFQSEGSFITTLSSLSETTQSYFKSWVNDTSFLEYPRLKHDNRNQSHHALKLEQSPKTNSIQPAEVTAAPNPVFVAEAETTAVTTPHILPQVVMETQLLSTAETGIMRGTAIQQPTVTSPAQMPITSNPQFIGTLHSVSEESVISKIPVQFTTEFILHEPEQNRTEIRPQIESIRPRTSEQIFLQGPELPLQQKLGLHSQPGLELTHSREPELISQPEQELASEREPEVIPQLKLNLMNERDQEQVQFSSQIKTEGTSIRDLEWTSQRQPELISEQETGLNTVLQTASGISKISNLSSLEELKLNNPQKLAPQLSFRAVPETDFETSPYEVKADQEHNEVEHYRKSKTRHLKTHPLPLKKPIPYSVTGIVSPSSKTSVLLTALPASSDHEVSDISTADKVSVVFSQLNTPTSPGTSYIGRRKPLVLPRRFRTELQSTHQPLFSAFHRTSFSETQSPMIPETQSSTVSDSQPLTPSATQVVIEQILNHQTAANATLQASNLIKNSLASATLTPTLTSLPTINVFTTNEPQVSLQSAKELYITGPKPELIVEPQANFQIKINSTSQSITKPLTQGLNLNYLPQSKHKFQVVTQATSGDKTSASTASISLPKTLQPEKVLDSIGKNPVVKIRSFGQLVETTPRQELELKQQREQTSLTEAELDFLSKLLFGTSPQPYRLKQEKQQASETLEPLAVKETNLSMLPLLKNLVNANLLTSAGAGNLSSIDNIFQPSITTNPQTPVFAFSPSEVVNASNLPLVGDAEMQVVQLEQLMSKLRSKVKSQIKADMASQKEPELTSQPEEEPTNKIIPNLPAVLQISDLTNLTKQVKPSLKYPNLSSEPIQSLDTTQGSSQPSVNVTSFSVYPSLVLLAQNQTDHAQIPERNPETILERTTEREVTLEPYTYPIELKPQSNIIRVPESILNWILIKSLSLPPILPKPKLIRKPAFGLHTLPQYAMKMLAQPVAEPSLVSLSTPAQLKSESMALDFVCKEENGYYSVDNECGSYIQCQQYNATKFSCPSGLYFRPNTKYYEYPCVKPSEVKCVEKPFVEQDTKTTGLCPKPYGLFSINDGDCSKFIMCNIGVATIMSCPAGLVFNPTTESCDWLANVPQCSPQVFQDYICPNPPIDEKGVESDVIYKYKYGEHCKLYIACQRGYPRLLSCENGLAFDEISQSCVKAGYVKNCGNAFSVRF